LLEAGPHQKDLSSILCSSHALPHSNGLAIGLRINHNASTILDYLFARMVNLGLELDLGREKPKITLLTSLKHPGKHWIKGRLAISGKIPNRFSSVLDKFGLAGLIELCRFGL
jgi:hypothetical protein